MAMLRHGGTRQMATARVRRWRVEAGLVRLTGADRRGEGVVDVEDDAPGAVVTVELCLVPTADDGEGVNDEGYGVARGREADFEPRQVCRRLAVCRAPVAALLCRQVEVEEGGVQLAAEQEAARLVPAERRAVPAAVLHEGLHIPRAVCASHSSQRWACSSGTWRVVLQSSQIL